MRVLNKGGQQAEFTTGDHHRFPLALEGSSREIQAVVTKADDLAIDNRCSGGHCTTASQHSFNSRREFPGHEGLGKVVISSLLEADDAINSLAPGGKHHDWEIIAPIAQAPEDR